MKPYFFSKLRNLGLPLLIAFWTVACSSTPNNTTGDMENAEATTAAAAEAEKASLVTEVGFDKGSSQLSEDTKKEIYKLVERAKTIGNVDEIRVLSWADQEYPTSQKKKLPNPQRDLAKKRNKTVENYIKTTPVGSDFSVKTYSMAERPGLISEWLNTSDARVKKSLVDAGIPTTASDDSVTNKASRSIVMVLLKE